MSFTSQLQPKTLAPLDSDDVILDLIQNITKQSREHVVERLLLEEQDFPANVPKEFRESNAPQNEWTPELLTFYQETNSFLFETFVWNRNPLKLEIRKWLANIIQNYSDQKLKILCYGDGLGFESAFLAGFGHDVTYQEVSQPAIEIAREVARLNSVDVTIQPDQSQFQSEEFDVIVCCDVLEHLPDPPAQVAEFETWLKPDGLLIINAPFFLVNDLFPTHLRSNLKYAGDYRNLYKPAGFELLAGTFMWLPVAFGKESSPETRRKMKRTGNLLKTKLGSLFLRLSRITPFLHCWGARIPLRLMRSRHQVEPLQKMLDELREQRRTGESGT
ncbi:MAG: class I SAM-dependent methyltransferase [Planctomycetaceae bacterium]|nr:class I SAM-dependent methyltransferase [Planctomycetaceae bacterium]